MPKKAIPEEAVSEFVQERLEKELPQLIEKAVRKQAEVKLEPKIVSLVEKVLADLEERGVDTERSNVDVVRIATETVVDAVLNGKIPKTETVDIPVAGRQNKTVSTNLETESMDGPTTITREVEIPVAGQKDGEHSTTVEQEVIEPPGDPRLNGDLSPFEIALVYQGGAPGGFGETTARTTVAYFRTPPIRKRSPSPVGRWRTTMSESVEPAAVTPEDAARVVRSQTNRVYNPVVSTQEVAEELEISTEDAFELLEEAPRPNGKPVGETHVWWE